MMDVGESKLKSELELLRTENLHEARQLNLCGEISLKKLLMAEEEFQIYFR